MEPFGILQFLQSILPQSQPERAQQSEQPAENQPQTSEETQEPAPQTSSSQDAIMRFIEAHENRAKRTKRN